MAMRREMDTPEHRHPTGGEKAMDSSPSLAGLQVVVVDDEADTRSLLHTLLERCGAEVRAAGSAAEALALIAELKPDVLVSDIGMPEQDGYELIAKVRGHEAGLNERIPAIALTAYARLEDRIRALNAGFQVHVPKPIEPAELIAVVASLTGRTGKA
jgi:CheY-like chemotaxis protein